MKIESLYLKNFRNVEEQTFHFNPHFTVLIGVNGKGKSTWLHALRIACGAYLLSTPDTKKRHIIPDEVRKSNQISFFLSNYPVLIEAKGYFPEYKEVITWRRKQIEGKTGTSSSTEDIGLVRDLGKKKYDLMKTGSDDLNLPIIAFFGTSRVHGAARNRTTRLGRQIFKEGYHSWYEMRSSIFRYDSWLASYSILVSQGKEYAETEQVFWKAITTANPYIKSIKFEHNEIWLQVVMEGYTSEYLPLHLHSDGIISFTEMTAELAYRCIILNGNKRNQAIEDTLGVVMIDELDLHLHPSWQRHVVSDLKHAFPKIQFVATTHSPFIVQSLNKDELINLDLGIGKEGLENNPSNYGIEDVSEIEMGVEDVARSESFNERVDTAIKYYQLIAKGKSSENDDYVATLRQQLNVLEERFSDDPTFVANLKLERTAKLI
jgi:predicted ATP-binding protein involved in virulence